MIEMYYTVAPIAGRDKLGKYLCERGRLHGHAVEVGTHRAEYARILMESWYGTLDCVDPWSIPPGYEYQAKFLWGGPTREDDYIAALRVSQDYHGFMTLHRMTSKEAAPLFDGNSLDLVYLDGDHELPGFLDDLNLWWPKVNPGGILAGHDVLCPGEVGGGWGKGIQTALTRFCSEQGISEVQLLPEKESVPWSFLIEKPDRESKIQT